MTAGTTPNGLRCGRRQHFSSEATPCSCFLVRGRLLALMSLLSPCGTADARRNNRCRSRALADLLGAIVPSWSNRIQMNGNATRCSFVSFTLCPNTASWVDICPTPYVPYSVTTYGCDAGIMVTASHNPKEDNGYKVYWGNGAQIVSPHDSNIAAHIASNLRPWWVRSNGVGSGSGSQLLAPSHSPSQPPCTPCLLCGTPLPLSRYARVASLTHDAPGMVCGTRGLWMATIVSVTPWRTSTGHTTRLSGAS